MILQGLSPELLVRLLSLDRPGDDDSWLLFGGHAALVEEAAPQEEPPVRWAAE